MKKNYIAQILGGVLVLSGLVFSMVFFDKNKISTVISSIITILATIIGVIAFWIQFKKETDANQAQFIMELQKNMVEFNLANIKNKMYKTDNEEDFSAEDLNDMSNYIIFFENIAPMVFDNVLTLDLIDDLFSFNFFLVANHPIAQKIKIIPHADGFCGFIRLHKIWTDYKKEIHRPILKEDTSLDKNMPNYKDYTAPRKKLKNVKRKRSIGFS